MTNTSAPRTIRIAPVRKEVVVETDAAQAFDVFTTGIDRWWPRDRCIGGPSILRSVIEPFVGGRWYTVCTDGSEVTIGHVRVWEPGARLIVGWEISAQWTPTSHLELASEVEVRFIAETATRTRVALEHRDFERMGALDGEKMRNDVDRGWPSILERYVCEASNRTTAPSLQGRFIVHTLPGSPFGRAAMIALEEKGIPWTLAVIAPGAHHAPPHLRRHPFGRVPVLEHDGFQLYETQAILRYLDRILPHPALTPSDPRRAARMDQLMGINDWYLFHGVANVILFNRIFRQRIRGEAPDEAAIAAAMPNARNVFGVLADLLGKNIFFTGDSLTLADILLAPQLDMFSITPEWQTLTADKPHLCTWLDRMRSRPSLAATTWERVAAIAAA
jgi:glutathione S-transferase